MATTSHDTTTEEFAARLTDLRRRTGDPSYRSIARSVTQLMDGTLSTSHETMRLMHEGGKDPNVVKLEALIGLARYYHVENDALGSVASRRLNAAWPGSSEGDQVPVTRCEPRVSQLGLFEVWPTAPEVVIDLREPIPVHDPTHFEHAA